MAEIAARAPTLTLGLDFDRFLRATQRLFAPFVLLHIIWSIALSSGLISGLAIKLFNSSAAEFTVGFWLIQQQALRALVLIVLIGTAIGVGLHRNDNTGYAGKAVVGLFGTVVIWLIAERVFFVTST